MKRLGFVGNNTNKGSWPCAKVVILFVEIIGFVGDNTNKGGRGKGTV